MVSKNSDRDRKRKRWKENFFLIIKYSQQKIRENLQSTKSNVQERKCNYSILLGFAGNNIYII